MTGKEKHIEKPTAADIKLWKDKYGSILKYQSTDGKVAYFREPDISTLDASAAIASTSPVKSNQVILKACFIGGDEAVITERKYLMGLMPHMQRLVSKVEGEFSEL